MKSTSDPSYGISSEDDLDKIALEVQDNGGPVCRKLSQRVP